MVEPNKILVEKVLEFIPKNVKLADYLMEVLNLKKDSAYRRIRGDIPFTYNEVIKLSSELNFSLDELLHFQKESYASFNIQANLQLNTQETFFKMLEAYHKDLLIKCKSKKNEMFFTMNRLLPMFSIWFPNLFKFSYFKWKHQMGEIALNTHFAEIIIPNEILELCEKVIKSPLCPNSTYTYIVDQYLYLNAIKEIQYYYKRKLLTQEELRLLKDEMRELIEHIEHIAVSGFYEGISLQYYLSTLEVESNTIYIKCDKGAASYFWVYSICPLYTTHAQSCFTHKKWINSLKKYSILISQSNEMMLAEFFGKQYKYLDAIESVDMY